MGNEQQPPCPACGGGGQLNIFKGESRFLLSVEECPTCCGLGYLLKEERTECMKQEQESEQKNGK